MHYDRSKQSSGSDPIVFRDIDLNRRIPMLDHVFLSVSDIERSIAFYTQALAALGIADRVDYDGKDGPPGHPDLKGFGCKGRIFFWLRPGVADSRAAHVGFIANSQAAVDAAYAAAMAAGATDNGKPSALFSRAGSTPSPNRHRCAPIRSR
jgi:catechol 2,3-dioxygenase-like lactoylglutathione lyase family enzyme